MNAITLLFLEYYLEAQYRLVPSEVVEYPPNIAWEVFLKLNRRYRNEAQITYARWEAMDSIAYPCVRANTVHYGVRIDGSEYYPGSSIGSAQYNNAFKFDSTKKRTQRHRANVETLTSPTIPK